MYDFHYSFIINYFDAELLFTDTDSLACEIKSKDVYEESFKHKHLLGYMKDWKFFDQVNKNVIGKMKDESKRKIIDKFVGLKSKMYIMKNIDGKQSNTAKRVNIALSLMNSKTLCSTRKYSNIKWEEFKAKNVKWEHRK